MQIEKFNILLQKVTINIMEVGCACMSSNFILFGFVLLSGPIFWHTYMFYVLREALS